MGRKYLFGFLGCDNLHSEVALCSHGKTTSPQLISDNLAYFREIERRARTLLDSRPDNSVTQEELEEVLEDWILLRVSRHLPLPTVNGIDIMKWEHL